MKRPSPTTWEDSESIITPVMSIRYRQLLWQVLETSVSFDFGIISWELICLTQYLHTRLKIELNLQNKEREKEFADWEDIKIVLHHIIVEDPHIYHHPRFRAQLVCIFLLIADDGERLGAVARSESYRKSEEALCYEVLYL